MDFLPLISQAVLLLWLPGNRFHLNSNISFTCFMLLWEYYDMLVNCWVPGHPFAKFAFHVTQLLFRDFEHFLLCFNCSHVHFFIWILKWSCYWNCVGKSWKCSPNWRFGFSFAKPWSFHIPWAWQWYACGMTRVTALIIFFATVNSPILLSLLPMLIWPMFWCKWLNYLNLW